MRYLYTFLFYLILPFIFLRLLWKSYRLPAYRNCWRERLGFVPCELKECIWVHAISVGETIAAIPLIKALQAQYPNMPIVVTNMTPTGAARVKALLGDSVRQFYIPYDLPTAVRRFLTRTHPKIGIILETELWPNLFIECRNRAIPLIIANACLSEKSASGYQYIPSLIQEIFSAVSVVAAQSGHDANQFIKLGMPKEKITITGNLKFDLEFPMNLSASSSMLQQYLGNRPIWIAASTHPTEEEIILAAHRKIQQYYPNALLILVPRHPNRFDEVAKLIKKSGFRLIRRSVDEIHLTETEVYLGDTMGELLLLYSVSDAACVGGTFSSVGGHNLLEPAALAKPIVTGPQLFTVKEISQSLLSTKGLLIVKNEQELAEAIIHFFADPQYAKNIGKSAQQVIEENRGALKKHLNIIENYL